MCFCPVSYTHLDVYKRQPHGVCGFFRGSGQSEGSNQQEPVSPESGSAESKATENRELLVRFAVENNPVLEGWGNKIVMIKDGE